MRVSSRFSIAFVLGVVLTATPVFAADDITGATPSTRAFESVTFGSAPIARPIPADVKVPMRPVNPTLETAGIMTADVAAARGPIAEALVASDGTAQPFVGRLAGPGRPKALPVLYASLAALQVMDVVSTTKGLNAGAVEANPVMAKVVGNKAAFVAVKAGTTAVSIYLAERL